MIPFIRHDMLKFRIFHDALKASQSFVEIFGGNCIKSYELAADTCTYAKPSNNTVTLQKHTADSKKLQAFKSFDIHLFNCKVPIKLFFNHLQSFLKSLNASQFILPLENVLPNVGSKNHRLCGTKIEGKQQKRKEFPRKCEKNCSRTKAMYVPIV